MTPEPVGALAANLVNFSRLLRASGIPVGLDRTLSAARALQAVGLERKEDVQAALGAVMLSRHEQQAIFDAAFKAFWRDPKLLESLMAAGQAGVPGTQAPREPSALPRRLQQALAAGLRPGAVDAHDLETDAALSWSEHERLRKRDFESMSLEEFDTACRLVRQVNLPIDPVLTRRFKAATSGPMDLRGTLARAARDPSCATVARRARRMQPPPVVVLCDVSGSMDRYARILLYFAHALMQGKARVSVFTFGTRLTDVTRALRHRDPDEAIAAAAAVVTDWGGGTRIGPCLDQFTRQWARRVLTGNAALLLVTDGLDRAEDDSLSQAAQRLSRFTRQFIWLNPLLRFEGFQPRAAGVRALLPHVDRHLPVHSLDSLADLASAIRQVPGTSHRAPHATH